MLSTSYNPAFVDSAPARREADSVIQNQIHESARLVSRMEPRDQDELSLNREMGARAREIRAAKRLNQSEICAATGLSIGMVSDLENGKRSWKLRHLVLFGEALGVGLSSLLPPRLLEGPAGLATEPAKPADGVAPTDSSILERLLDLSTRQADELKALALELAGRGKDGDTK